MTRIRLDAVQFGWVFTQCKENPLIGYKLGYICNGHMTPESFIRANEVELIDNEDYYVEVAI